MGVPNWTEKSLDELSNAEFEALLTVGRGVMKGLQLTEAQRRKALEYKGSINHGPDELRTR